MTHGKTSVIIFTVSADGQLQNQLAKDGSHFFGTKLHFCFVIFTLVIMHFMLPFMSQAQYTLMSTGTVFDQIDFMDDYSGLSCVDFDLNGWDDITVSTNGGGVRTFRNIDGAFEEVNLFPGLTGQFRACTWIDFDNDGDRDFFATRMFDVGVLMRNNGDMTFTDISAAFDWPSYDAHTHAASWGDYDGDGFLDVYVCNYETATNITSWLFHNNGNETFTRVDQGLDVSHDVKSTFQSSWFDYDLDRDADLLVVSDRMDGNSLYRNNGNGTFTEVNAGTGLGIQMDAMGVAWSDFDHDADFDLYITNTQSGNNFLKNEEGHFVEVAEEYNIRFEGAVSFGCVWIDYDNNTMDDLYIATNTSFDGGQNYFCIWQPDSTFSHTQAPSFENDDDENYAVAAGDFDNNGFPDFVVGRFNPSGVNVWMNQMQGGNWIKLGLTGTSGNRDAVGATLRVYANNEMYLSHTQSGESFMGQNSQYEIVGVDQASKIDSLHIDWPTGWTDRFYDLPVNTFYSFSEGETYADVFDYEEITLCPDEELILNAGNSNNYLWSTGDTTSSIVVDHQGLYSVSVEGDFGFNHTMEFEVNAFYPPVSNLILSPPSCHDASDGYISLEINQAEVSNLEWSNFASGYFLSHLFAGPYSYTITYQNGCVQHEEFELTEPDVLLFDCEDDTVCFNSTTPVNWNVLGGSAPYQINWNQVDSLACSAGEHTLTVTDVMGCVATASFTIYEREELLIDASYEPICYGELASLQLEVLNSTSEVTFDFDELDPTQIPVGEYVAYAVDENFCTTEINFTIEENPPMSLEYEVVNVVNGQSGSIAVFPNGGTPPYTFLWNGQPGDSIVFDVTAGLYACVVEDAAGCFEQIEMNVIETGIFEANNAWEIFPNPFAEKLSIHSTRNEKFTLCDVTGKSLVKSTTSANGGCLDTSELSPGIYFLVTKNQTYKMIKQ